MFAGNCFNTSNELVIVKKETSTKNIPNNANGNILARSFDKSSLQYAVALTTATTATETNNISWIDEFFDKKDNNPVNIANQKNAKRGNNNIYSTR